ncbi:hypothetical protein DYB37_007370 [Aphanomyces astaci]|uniref:Uncharacterized protein n=1 Tax=Aphanomyces astaci TaxID=112090 RepID=A0A418DKJ4_APHAT|nr:hypothetical protein DYB35_007476 [Aphanomyces astaci]RHZ35125.1 hypothetical protein DYB37_007370 [Aphanomyces astaci]
MQGAKECIRGAVLNLETSIIRGECQGCLSGSPTGICQSGDVCQDKATYLTQLSVLYAEFKHEPVVSSMGLFNGVFYSIFRMSAISGNLISSLVLGYFVWPAESLFVMYTVIGLSGAALMLMLPSTTKVSVTDDTELAKLVQTPSVAPGNEPSRRGRMVVLAPVFVLNGLQQGFATGEFTSNFIRESVGGASIGYVMALYGGCNVVSSYGFGKLADKHHEANGSDENEIRLDQQV